MLLLCLQSCSDKTAVLTKTWKIEDLKYPTEVPAALQETIKNTVNEMKKSFTITYNADGTYVTKVDDKTLRGKWKLNWNSSKITSTTENGESKDFKVRQLDDTHFEFETQEGEGTVIFVMIPANNSAPATDVQP